MINVHISKIVAPVLLSIALTSPLTAVRQYAYSSVRSSLLVNQTMNEKLDANVDTLSKLSELVSRIKLAESDTPEQREIVISSAENIIRSLDFIRQDLGTKKLILSGEVLGQLNANAEFLIFILNKLDQGNPKLDKKSQERIMALEKEINSKMSRFNEIKGTPTLPPTPYPTVRVSVRTLKGGRPEPNLTIYYLDEGYFVGDSYYDEGLAKKNTKPFDRVSSPSDRELPVGAVYRIWACRGGNSTPVSEIKKVEVIPPSTGEEQVVDLIVVK